MAGKTKQWESSRGTRGGVEPLIGSWEAAIARILGGLFGCVGTARCLLDHDRRATPWPAVVSKVHHDP